MAAEAHLLELKYKHAKIDNQIKQEMKSPLPDTLRISMLKRKKLQIKDLIIASKSA